MVLQRPVKF